MSGYVSHRPAVHRMRGFTLLEAVVTLVVVSLLVAILMQSLSHALSLRTRLLRVQAEARTDFLQEAWFREAVGAAQADFDNALGNLEGRVDQLEYATPVPLVAQGMSRARWWISGRGDAQSLHYADSAVADMVIVAGPLRDARFAYLGLDGLWRESWTPAPDDPERLPKLVRFEAVTDRGVLYWLVPLLADPIPPSQLRTDELEASGI
ncbi:prepilin-type N-terminal cleavage/methylation domain-containing protein [Luteimonas terrae]|uniref:Prepilin-type N-terminal cleavage/methylation domain-containing protein n=1 Tax=Luteimonas terrae TaxID=1530191 RepID=A0A4R5U7M2_9GAMM|nr:prepilin-type N-terminal cleavage/methylation domain-containing protein [Luteimonas terrae]TDK29977.1 prepilin-type N-terminal cleavage/methylation domain-containing protein [Luteimonas terrae]